MGNRGLTIRKLKQIKEIMFSVCASVFTWYIFAFQSLKNLFQVDKSIVGRYKGTLTYHLTVLTINVRYKQAED